MARKSVDADQNSMKTPETVNLKASVADLMAVTAVRLWYESLCHTDGAACFGIHRDYGHG